MIEIETVLCDIDFLTDEFQQCYLIQLFIVVVYYIDDFGVTNKPLPRMPRFVPCPKIFTPQHGLRCL